MITLLVFVNNTELLVFQCPGQREVYSWKNLHTQLHANKTHSSICTQQTISVRMHLDETAKPQQRIYIIPVATSMNRI